MSPIDQARRDFYLAMLERFRFAIDEAECWVEVDPRADLLAMIGALTAMKRACQEAVKQKDANVLRMSAAALLATCKP